jgi:MHS family proline/betaine transporter-like MFS transporter
VLAYMPVYLSNELGLSETAAFVGSTISLAVYLGSIFVMGALSDRFGRRAVLIACSALFAVLTVPLFALLGGAGVGLFTIFAVWSVFGVLLSMNGGTLPTFLCELFPTRVRFSGFALSFNAANALFGGTAPLIATWLIGATGSTLAPAWYLVFAAVVTLGAIAMSTAGRAGSALQDE